MAAPAIPKNKFRKMGPHSPDRAATDTDGIAGSWSSRQQNPSISWLSKEGCCKSRPQMRRFWSVLVRMEEPRECSDRKIVSRCREREGRVYYGAIFEAKKEIPA
jgi:hypothetical protein